MRAPAKAQLGHLFSLIKYSSENLSGINTSEVYASIFQREITLADMSLVPLYLNSVKQGEIPHPNPPRLSQCSLL